MARQDIRDATVDETANRGRAGMSDQNASVAVLETKISSMSEDIAHIRAAVDALNKTLSRLPVIEERSRGQSEAIDRAFKEIERLDKEIDRLDQEQQNERDRVNKWIYGISGAALAVSLFWSLLGVYVTDNVKQIVSTNEDMRVHMLVHEREQGAGQRESSAESRP